MMAMVYFSKNYKKYISFKEQEDFYPSYSSILNFISKIISLFHLLYHLKQISGIQKREMIISILRKRGLFGEKKTQFINSII